MEGARPGVRRAPAIMVMVALVRKTEPQDSAVKNPDFQRCWSLRRHPLHCPSAEVALLCPEVVEVWTSKILQLHHMLFIILSSLSRLSLVSEGKPTIDP